MAGRINDDFSTNPSTTSEVLDMSNFRIIGEEPARANKTAAPPPEPVEPPVEGVFQNELANGVWEAFIEMPDGVVKKLGSSRFKHKAEHMLADAKQST